jgi:hypothetical protein
MTDIRQDPPVPIMLEPTDPAHAGHGAYTKRTLQLYDTLVVRLSNSLV